MTSLLADLYAALEKAPAVTENHAADGPRRSGPSAVASSPAAGVSSSAAVSGPGVDPSQADTSRGPGGTNGKSIAGPSGMAALSSSKLRSVVRAARVAHGPRRARWSVRERLAWHELIVTRNESA